MFEVSLDPHAAEGLSAHEMTRQMWRFSREEMAKGTLDAIGEQTFTDGKVRKALDTIMRDAPRTLLNLVRSVVGDGQIPPQSVKQSLARIWIENAATPLVALAAAPASRSSEVSSPRGLAALKAAATRREKATRTSTPYDESHHTEGKPQEVLELYRAVDRLCLSLNPGHIDRRHVAMTINYVDTKAIFCCLRLLQGGLRVWVKLKYSHLDKPPSFARDVSGLGHYGVGDLELAISSMAQLNEATLLIRQSYESIIARRE
jgi:hypothetical protein